MIYVKPNIFKRGLYWWCMGGTACAAGCSQTDAWDQWVKLVKVWP